jgi:hypothetical protein
MLMANLHSMRMSIMMELTQKHVKEICKLRGGIGTCSFLIMGEKGFECSKGTTYEACIQRRINEGSMVAKGDNCEGRTGSVENA